MFCEQHLFVFNRQVIGISIPRITAILYILKQSFDRTNLSFFTVFFTILDFSNYSSTDTRYYYFFGLLFVKYCCLGFYLSSFHCWFLTFSTVLIVPEFIDNETCPQVWLKIAWVPYPKRTCIFSSPAGLWNVVARFPVGFSDFFD